MAVKGEGSAGLFSSSLFSVKSGAIGHFSLG
jgi:hypothetical protein